MSGQRAPVREVRELLGRWVALRSDLSSARALPLEAQGTDDGVLWRRTQVAERRLEEFRRLTRMAARLTPLEVRIVELQNTPDMRVRNGHLEVVTVRARRSVPESDVVHQELLSEVLEPGTLSSVRWTADGAEMVHRAEQYDEERRSFVADEGRVVVEERVPVRLSNARIAENLGMSRRELARRIEQLYATVREWAMDEALQRQE